MSESRESQLEAWKTHRAKIKQKVAEGKIDPYSDSETMEQIHRENLSQTPNIGEEDYNPHEPLARNADQDPNSPSEHLPRKPFGKPINQPVVTQSTLEGSSQKVVLSRTGKTRVLKSAQPYERARLGIDDPKNQQKADSQRHEIRKSMKDRGENV